MKTIKAPSATRAPTWLGRVDRRELRSHCFKALLHGSCEWVRAAEDAPRCPFRPLERRHGLADIVERGAGVIVERRRVNRPQPKRGDITLPEDPLRHRNHFAQQCLGLFEAPQINKGRRVAQLTFAQLA